ncbi:hypothetical protein EJB05_44816 [Eragrostis curvula]|uniref:Uncharacterized protein n=1 Tax=Eragrostis curvula TaxID=38414 RepID=A0A5J9TIM8_9POAL|nr:hypothetical protein EJB05_44816 [Eragrostis curvula]
MKAFTMHFYIVPSLQIVLELMLDTILVPVLLINLSVRFVFFFVLYYYCIWFLMTKCIPVMDIKECSIETMDIIPSGSDYMCEDSSTSEYIASNGLQLRADDASSYEEPASDPIIEAPALGYHEEPDQPVPGPLLDSNVDTIYSGFPPSFSQMLSICSTENEKDAEGPNPVTTTKNSPREVYAPGTSHDVAVVATEKTADKGKDAAEGIDASNATSDLMARIKSYMAEDSFHDMLFKLEKVIDELGGDMSL